MAGTPMSDDAQLSISVAVIQHQMTQLTEDMKEARHARKNSYIVQEKQNEILLKIEHRMEKVENFVIGASPTLAEFNALKMKAEGAGMLGKALWVSLGVMITFVAWASGLIQALIAQLR